MAIKKKKEIKTKKEQVYGFALFSFILYIFLDKPVTLFTILTKLIIGRIVGGEALNVLTLVFIGIIIPFIGTTLGAGIVLFTKNNYNEKLNKIFLGFASGIMIAASIWSLIIPAIEMAEEQGIPNWIPACVGIILGGFFIPSLDKFINLDKIKLNTNKKNILLALSITLHNIPEGMAVGIVFANALSGNFETLVISAFSLSIGIAIQNLPEGAAISLPLSLGNGKKKAFTIGMLSRNSRANISINYNITC